MVFWSLRDVNRRHRSVSSEVPIKPYMFYVIPLALSVSCASWGQGRLYVIDVGSQRRRCRGAPRGLRAMRRKIQGLEPGVRDKDFGLKARHQAAWTYAIPQPRRAREVAGLPILFARILRSRCGRKVAGRRWGLSVLWEHSRRLAVCWTCSHRILRGSGCLWWMLAQGHLSRVHRITASSSLKTHMSCSKRKSEGLKNQSDFFHAGVPNFDWGGRLWLHPLFQP